MKSSQPSIPCRAAFLGTGGIAAAHAEALATIPGVQLAAVCDLDERKAGEFQTRWGVGSAYTNLGEMLDRERPDVVHVLLPPAAHFSAARSCLESGSSILVEKPLCVSSRECAELESVARRQGVQVGVNHNFTWMPGIIDAIEAIRACRLGAVEHMTVMYSLPMPGLAAGPHSHWMFRDPGHLMFELGSHPLSSIYRFCGGAREVRSLAAGEMQLSNGAMFYPVWEASMVCQRATAQMLLAVGKPFYNIWLHILGEDGEVFIDIRRATVRISENTRYTRADNLVDGLKNSWSLLHQSLGNFSAFAAGAIGIRPAFAWQQRAMERSIGSFYADLIAGRPVSMDAREGAAVVRMCEAVVESGLAARRGAAVEDVTHG